MFTYVATALDAPAQKETRVDYNRVLGYGSPVERIDPHVHVLRPQAQPELLELVKTIRSKFAARSHGVERNENSID